MRRTTHRGDKGRTAPRPSGSGGSRIEIAETQRYAHLLGHESVRTAQLPGIEGVGGLPAIDGPEAVDRWLQRAAQVYESHKAACSERHEIWRGALAEHRIWSWTPPPLARSRHADFGVLLLEIEAC